MIETVQMMPDNPSNKDIQQLLAAIPYFADLQPAFIHQLAQYARRQSYDVGQIAFLEGERNAGLYIVETGWLKVIKTSPEGREQVLQFIGPGETFNAVGVLAQDTNPATAIALEAVSLLVIPKQTILDLVYEHPDLAQVMIRHLAQRVQQLVQMVEDFSLRSIEARVARYLIDYGHQNSLTRPNWATQAEIANRIGTVPDVLNRALRSLAKENLIRVERHQIHILDYERLEEKAQFDK